jgi:hypothetical protein
MSHFIDTALIGDDAGEAANLNYSEAHIAWATIVRIRTGSGGIRLAPASLR